MSNVIFVTGPAGAGKTTTCEALAATADGTWACISQDHVRTFVKAGYAFADMEWTEETHKQWDVSIAICCAMVQHYVAAGIDCVVDLFAPPLGFNEKWKPVIGHLSYRLVVLLPAVETTLARNARREGHARLEESHVREHHRWFAEWAGTDATIIDSTSDSVERVVAKLMKTAHSGLRRSP